MIPRGERETERVGKSREKRNETFPSELFIARPLANTVAAAQGTTNKGKYTELRVDLSPSPPTPRPSLLPLLQPLCKADLISAYAAHGALTVLLAAHSASLPGNTPGRRVSYSSPSIYPHSHSSVLVIVTGDVEHTPKSRCECTEKAAWAAVGVTCKLKCPRR